MRIFWNPWHGCHKISDGCKNCYVYILDKIYGRDASIVSRSKTNFNLPIARNRLKQYRYPSGTIFATCFNSDFFIEEADNWRQEVWNIIEERSDCTFFVITKRAERIQYCLPSDMEKFQNLQISVTTENQIAADTRLPIFLSLKLPYYGITVAPILEDVNLVKFLQTGKINEVSVGGESYVGARVTDLNHVKSIYNQSRAHGVKFRFHQTGKNLLKDGKILNIPRKLEYQTEKYINSF